MSAPVVAAMSVAQATRLRILARWAEEDGGALAYWRAIALDEARRRGVGRVAVNEAADEAVADACARFLRVPRGVALDVAEWGGGDHDEDARAYMTVIVQRAVVDVWRRVTKRGRSWNTREAVGDHDGLFAHRPFRALGSAPVVEDPVECLAAAEPPPWLARVRATERRLAVRHYVDGVPLAALAEEEGTTRASVKMRLWRFRRRLRSLGIDRVTE